MLSEFLKKRKNLKEKNTTTQKKREKTREPLKHCFPKTLRNVDGVVFHNSVGGEDAPALGLWLIARTPGYCFLYQE